VGLDGNTHHISFRGIRAKPTVESHSQGQGPEGFLIYETVDGEIHEHRISGNEAAAVLASYDQWAEHK
jgi:hypothetical protein